MKTPRQQQLEAFLTEDPNDPFTHYALALEFQKGGEGMKYQQKLEWMIHNFPEYLASYYQMGKYYESINKIEEAISVFKKGMELAKNQNNNKEFKELKSALDELTE